MQSNKMQNIQTYSTDVHRVVAGEMIVEWMLAEYYCVKMQCMLRYHSNLESNVTIPKTGMQTVSCLRHARRQNNFPILIRTFDSR